MDDSDIEGYEICMESNIGIKDKIFQTCYLRDCLEFLRYPENKEEPHKRQKAALENIPILIANSPADASDLCIPIVNELICMQNSYSMTNFGELQSKAVVSLIVHHPQLVVPILSASASNKHRMAIGARLSIIDFLIGGARELSAIPKDLVKTKGVNELDLETLSVSRKTTIKRPRKLETLHSQKLHFTNKFSSNISELFFYPIVKLLCIETAEYISGSADFSPFDVASPQATILEKGLFSSSAVESSSRKSSSSNTSSSQLESSERAARTLPKIHGIDALIPTQCLYALSAFVECSIHTTKQL
jgi:hypothetical protein